MTLPAGIDEATWRKALRVIGHPWREGQRCDATVSSGLKHGNSTCDCGWVSDCDHFHKHNIPIPSVTDELLMRMLDALGSDGREWELSYCPSFKKNTPFEVLIDYGRMADDEQSEFTFYGVTKDAAIILATASLEGK